MIIPQVFKDLRSNKATYVNYFLLVRLLKATYRMAWLKGFIKGTQESNLINLKKEVRDVRVFSSIEGIN